MYKFDADFENTMQAESLAQEYENFHNSERSRHRCPMDMPPCPDCQGRQDLEDAREYGSH